MGEEDNESAPDYKSILSSSEMIYLSVDEKVTKLGYTLINSRTSELIELELEFKLNKIENYWKSTQISSLEQ